MPLTQIVVLATICLTTPEHGQLCQQVPLPRFYADQATCELDARRATREWFMAVRQVYGADYWIKDRRCGPRPPTDPDAE